MRSFQPYGACGLSLFLVLAIGCSSDDERAPTLGGGFGTGGAPSSPPGLDWESCPEGFDKYCAHLDVPLDWDAPDGETISVMIARHPARQTRTGQLWLLQGGPGASGAVFLDMLEAFGTIAPTLDIYVLEHRGVGPSTRLGCPSQESSASAQGTEITTDEYPDCLAYLQQEWGDGLRHFSTTQAARDLVHVIDETRGDGEDVFVFGVSYGTYWALRYLQVAPAQATGVILDSIAPPNFYISGFDAQFDPVGKELMDACAQDAACSAHLGDQPFSKLAEIHDSIDAGHCPAIGLDRPSLRTIMSVMLMSVTLREFVPGLAYRIERCSAEDEAAITHFFELLFYGGGTDPYFSILLQRHVALSELWPSPPPALEDLQDVVDGAIFAPDFAPAVAALYETWPRYTHDAYVSSWPSTSIPLLMMNGEMDPQTPIASARTVEDHLNASHQRFVSVPYAAHTVTTQSPVTSAAGYPCGFQLIDSFLAAPTAPLQDSCLQDLRPVGFDWDDSTLEIVWGVPDMWDNPGASLQPKTIALSPAAWTASAERFRRWIPMFERRISQLR